jgi:HK97 family phage major capsid protein
MRLKDLRERRESLAKEMRNRIEQNQGDKWTAEHQKFYDDGVAELDRIDGEISRIQRMNDLAAEEHLDAAARDAAARSASKAGDASPRGVYNAVLRKGVPGLTAEQALVFRNTMSTTTGSEGGFTVPTEIARSVIDALKAYGGVRGVATVLPTEQGNPLNWPNSDGTSETGELLAENAVQTSADPVFGTTALNVYKFGSKWIKVPIELLQDSNFDIEGFIQGRIRMRLGRVTNTFFTTGTGTSQPRGVVTAAGSGKVGTTGQTLTVIYDDLVDLEHSVDPAYREAGNCSFMMNDASVKVIKKLKDSQGMPIWLPSYNDGIRGGTPQTLLGYRIATNQDMAVMAANAKSILFGDFTQYIVRDALDVQMMRFMDSGTAANGQVWFLAWLRSGGNFVDVGNSLKYYQNSAT